MQIRNTRYERANIRSSYVELYTSSRLVGDEGRRSVLGGLF